VSGIFAVASSRHAARGDLSPKKMALLALLSAVLLVSVVTVARVPQGAYSDPGWQIKAVQQSIRNESPFPNDLRMPDPEDISRERSGWISFWAPGSELFLWPLMRFGLSPGTAVRITAGVCIVSGSVGWALWTSLFSLPMWLRAAVAVSLPWIHYSNESLFLYSAEALTFAAVPWVLLSSSRFCDALRAGSSRYVRPFGVGFLAGCLYVMKYSGVLISAGLALYIALVVWRLGRERRRAILSASAWMLGLILPIAGLNLANQHFSGNVNLVTASMHSYFRWQIFLHGIVNPALAIASGDAPLAYVLLHPTSGLLKGLTRNAQETWPALFGLPGGVLLLYLSLKRGKIHSNSQLAVYVFSTGIVLLMLLWSVTPVSYEARHSAAGALTLLPVVLARGYAWYKSSSSKGFLRIVLLAFAAVYLVLPVLYGVASAFGKVYRQRQSTAISGMYNPLLADRDAELVRQALIQGYLAATDIWYVTDPITALDLPGRVIVRHADFTDAEILRKEKFASTRPVRVRVVLPQNFESNGKSQIIRDSFQGARNWERCSSAGRVNCWIAQVEPQ
jgi:hypothetical protein